MAQKSQNLNINPRAPSANQCSDGQFDLPQQKWGGITRCFFAGNLSWGLSERLRVAHNPQSYANDPVPQRRNRKERLQNQIFGVARKNWIGSLRQADFGENRR
jgi:hypothetical protein